MQKNKFWKSTPGQNFESLVAAAVAYTAVADFPTFVASGAEGAIGLFNASTLALLPAAAAAAAGTEIIVALKRDGNVETFKFILGDASVKLVQSAFAAATNQVSIVTLTGTPVAGKEYGIKIIETTPGYQPFPSWLYTIIAVTGDTVTTVANKLVAKINDLTSAVNKGTDVIVTASNVAGVITLTASSALGNTIPGAITFKIGLTADTLNDLAPTGAIAYTGAGTQAAFQGSGTGQYVQELEKYGNIFKGVTTFLGNTNLGATGADFGQPTAFASAALNYVLYQVTQENIERSPTPVERHFHKKTFILAVPTAGGPAAAVSKILLNV